MIDSYSFGRMVIKGKSYASDVKIINNKVKSDWWRAEGHRLQLSDMEDVLEKKPKTIVVGTGHDGVMVVDAEVRDYCQKNNIQLIELKTADAVKRFNELAGRGVAGLFHLTC